MDRYELLYKKYVQLELENVQLKEEIRQIKQNLREVNDAQIEMISNSDSSPFEVSGQSKITQRSSNEEKINLFLSLFKGRMDVCAKRWSSKPGYSPYCYNDFKPGICQKPRIKCSDCKQSDFAVLDEKQIDGHLRGNFILGLYPLTKNDTCFLLVMDFDEATWEDEVHAMVKVCKELTVPVYIERSQSGNGCHLWFFFESEVKSVQARKFGMILLHLAMRECREIKFSAFDRLFPSQDFLQKDGFGNLIALPLQKKARELGNTVFLSEGLDIIKDQWEYLSSVIKINDDFISDFCNQHSDALVDHSDEDDRFINFLEQPELDVSGKLNILKENGLRISKSAISTRLLQKLRQLATYSNPEFFAKQAMRQSTFMTPRYTVVYDENSDYLTLPRGVESALIAVLNKTKAEYEVIDNKCEGDYHDFSFNGELTEHQNLAFLEMVKFDNGVLSATTGFGKTVIGTRLICEKKCSTLILVHTKAIAQQWTERIEQFILYNQLTSKNRKSLSFVGQLGGGKNSIRGIVDVAIMQSMFESDRSVKNLISNYGMVIVDECHHVSAVTFSRILSETKAKYVYGLSATPFRKDGHHPIIFMQCGPIRFKVDAKKEAEKRAFDHIIVPRFSNFRMPIEREINDWHISEIFQQVCQSQSRNNLIVTDIIKAIDERRNPLVLTERASHVHELTSLLSEKGIRSIGLTGKMKQSERKRTMKTIESLNEDERLVVIATGKLIGEGYDLPRLDTLFLAMPISWKGTISQYSGRLHRSFEGKENVKIIDYIDIHVPVLERMYQKRQAAYRAGGYNLHSAHDLSETQNIIYDDSDFYANLENDIQNSSKSIIISTPFMSKRKINNMKMLLVEKFQMGVKISMCLKPIEEYPQKMQKYISLAVTELFQQGIHIVYLAKNHYKCVIIDQMIVWYGGIDPFGGSYEDDSIMRIKDADIAAELFGVIMDSASSN
jgi:superfamily II DNA or RNA helicase